MRPVVCPGGGDQFHYDVGPEPGKFAMGLIHPRRDHDWVKMPNLQKLRDDCRGMPLGFNESMYFVEPRNAERAGKWYNRGGWTTDFSAYTKFAERAIESTDYFVFHIDRPSRYIPRFERDGTSYPHYGDSVCSFCGDAQHSR